MLFHVREEKRIQAVAVDAGGRPACDGGVLEGGVSLYVPFAAGAGQSKCYWYTGG